MFLSLSLEGFTTEVTPLITGQKAKLDTSFKYSLDWDLATPVPKRLETLRIDLNLVDSSTSHTIGTGVLSLTQLIQSLVCDPSTRSFFNASSHYYCCF